MYIYLLLNIAAFVLAFAFERTPFAEKEKRRKPLVDKCYFVFCGLLLLLSALRYGIAVDYDVYHLRYINGYETGNQLTLFVWIFRIMRALNIPYQIVIALCSAGFLVPIFYLIWRYAPRYKFFALGVLLGFMFYIQSYNIFRQYLAMGLFLLFISQYISTKKPVFLFLCIIPVLIHPIIALSLPLYAIALIWTPTKKQIRILQTVAILIFLLVSNEMTEWLIKKAAVLTLGNIPAYAHYANSMDTDFMNSIYNQSMEFIPKILYLPCLVLLPEIILGQQRKISKKRNKGRRLAWWRFSGADVSGYFVKVYFLYMCIMSFKLGSEIMSRFLVFFSILEILVVPIMFQNFFLVYKIPLFKLDFFKRGFFAKHPNWKILAFRLFQLGIVAVCIYTQIRCIRQNACGAYPYASVIDLLLSGA